MDTSELLSAIDAEIATLKQARALLAGGSGVGNGRAGRPAKTRHTMSPEGRARIAAAQRARWAKKKKAAK